MRSGLFEVSLLTGVRILGDRGDDGATIVIAGLSILDLRGRSSPKNLIAEAEGRPAEGPTIDGTRGGRRFRASRPVVRPTPADRARRYRDESPTSPGEFERYV